MEGRAMTTANPRDLAALQHLVTRIRPDWDTPGVHAALQAANRAAWPLERIAAAAIDAATTPTTRTPAGIGDRLRNGWAANTAAQPPRRDPAEAAAPYDRNTHGRAVAERATAAHRAQALTRARQALRAAQKTP
jgi:hypothetical protein